MATWSGRGLRGNTLEELINHSLEILREKKLALIQKIPTPITPIDIDKSTRHITLAYFDEKSTVDYIGVVQGIPVCFDAKECAGQTFPLRNIHKHQMSFMEDFERQEGVSFFVIFYTGIHKMYYVPYTHIKEFWDRAQNGGRKSITFDEMLEGAIELSLKKPGFIPILDALQTDINNRSD